MEKFFPVGFNPEQNAVGLVNGPITLVENEPTAAPAESTLEVTDDMIEAALPKPSGFKLLIAMPNVEEKYEGGVIAKVKETIQNEQITTVVALVLDAGPDAYADTTRFPSGAWCKPGDYVLIGPYKGQRFSVYGREYRIINDDNVEGVVPNPAGYRRI